MDVQIIYTSRTGNTEKLAEAVFAAVPVKEKNVKRIEERTERDDGDLKGADKAEAVEVLKIQSAQ